MIVGSILIERILVQRIPLPPITEAKGYRRAVERKEHRLEARSKPISIGTDPQSRSCRDWPRRRWSTQAEDVYSKTRLIISTRTYANNSGMIMRWGTYSKIRMILLAQGHMLIIQGWSWDEEQLLSLIMLRRMGSIYAAHPPLIYCGREWGV